jgi:hypothetical protein
MHCVSSSGGLIPSKTCRIDAHPSTQGRPREHPDVSAGRASAGFRATLPSRPALCPSRLRHSGAAAFFSRRAGLPFSLHPDNQFGQRLITFAREKPHDLADMRKKIHGVIPANFVPRGFP